MAKTIALATSGGKESRLAYELCKDKYHIDYFLTLVADGKVYLHGTAPDTKSRLIDITGKVTETTPANDIKHIIYAEAKGLLEELNVGTIIIGSINPIAESTWKICEKAGIEVVAPLCGWDKKRVIQELLKRGLKARVVKVGEGVALKVGTIIDEEFMNSEHGFDICGENGEYHTEVID